MSTDTDTQEVALDPKGREKALDVANELACDGGAPVREYVDGIIRAYLSAAQEGREAVAWQWLSYDGWHMCEHEAEADRLRDDGLEVRGLYPVPVQPAAQVVKGLRWPPECPRGQRVHGRGAPFDGVEYCIAHYGGSHGDDTMYRWAAPKSKWSEPFDSFDAAKAAAQADYEKRILSALASPTDADAAVPEGYVLVPVEPTEAMVDEADRAHPLPEHYIRNIYRAALTAAKAGEDGR